MAVTIDFLRGLNMRDAIQACDGLDPASRGGLINACSSNDHRPLFALRVAQDLLMPDNLSIGISGLRSNANDGDGLKGNGSIGDYGEGRSYIMQKCAKTPGNQRVLDAKKGCWNRWFYPEYKNISNVRVRLTTVASDHGWLNYNHLMEINLFSLNGFFNWDESTSSAHTYTTCGLFVRACRAAAHVLEKQVWPTNTPSGTDACIVGPSAAATVQYDQRGNREPKKGDFFHVHTPGLWEKKGKNDDHVGIILSHQVGPNGSWIWDTAEGGQGDGYETKLFRRILEFANGKHWHGDVNTRLSTPDDPTLRRPLIKWIDLDFLAKIVTN